MNLNNRFWGMGNGQRTTYAHILHNFGNVCSETAENKTFLRMNRFTHVLNTAEGRRFGQVDTGHAFYRDLPQIRYMGFPMTDHPSTDISRYFYIAAKFIDNALSNGGKLTVLLLSVLCCCRQSFCGSYKLLLSYNNIITCHFHWI